MEYRVIETNSLEELNSRVNTLLVGGWEPQGGVCVVYSPNSGSWWFYQALVLPAGAEAPSSAEEGRQETGFYGRQP
jgi:hypothetical protein